MFVISKQANKTTAKHRKQKAIQNGLVSSLFDKVEARLVILFARSGYLRFMTIMTENTPTQIAMALDIRSDAVST